MSTSGQGPAAQQAANNTISPGVRATSYTTLDQALTPSATSRGSRHPTFEQTAHNPHNPNSFTPPMASDGRYMYPQAQEAVAPPYGYPHYSAPPYEQAAQYPPNPQRPPPRNPSAPAHSPQQQAPPPQPAPFNPPPPAYPQPGYPPPGFAVPPGPPQWTPEGWTYPQPFPPQNPPPQETQTFAPPPPRPEVPPPNPPAEHRVHSGPPKVEPRREERIPRSEAAPHPKVRKTREPDPVPAPVPANPLGLDFVKLRESFQLIIDTSQAFATDPAHGRPIPTPETLERMLQAATYGAQALDSASKRVTTVTEVPQKPAEMDGEETETNGNATPSGGQNPEQAAPEGQTCLGCKATSTPEWRRGPLGPRTLCNACGLVYAKLIKKRTREPGRARGSQSKHNNKASRNDSGQGSSSEEEGSYGGSQERRSD